MLNDTDIEWICHGNKRSYRKWIVSEIRYDFEFDGYCELKLTDEKVAFGTPFDAYKYAKQILNKYKKQYSDANIVIREELMK